MGKIIKFDTCKKINGFVNDYINIQKEYEKKHNESINKDPYGSINNHFMKECKYKVSIIISSWNCSKTLLFTLKTIENTYICNNFNDKLEVIVVDDGSVDDTVNMIKTNTFNFELNFIKQIHLGRAQGINMGVSKSKGDIIIFCDADILLFPYTIDEIVKRQQDFLNEAVFFGFREDIDNVPEKVEDIVHYIQEFKPSFWKDNRFIYDFIGSWGSNMMLETNFLQLYSCKKNIWVSNNIKAIYDCWQLYRMVYGFLFSVSRENFYKVGGFAEFLVGWGCDDTSFISLCLEQNIKIIPVPSAHCLHIYHPIRMKSQWEDGKKNEKRMFDYISKENRINYMNQDFSSRILFEYKNKHDYTKLPIMIKEVNYNTKLEEADYNYFLGNLQKAKKLYLNIIKDLSLEKLENLFDIAIRLNDSYTFNLCKENELYLQCFFYHVANYYFNLNMCCVDDIVGFNSYYCQFLKNINKNDLKDRAEQYFYEEQWYLSYLDYFAISIYDNSYLDKCNKCLDILKKGGKL